jgi:hypothetical protein
MANLGSTYSRQGKWNEAEPLEVQVLDMCKKLLGAEHPDTLRSMANLASVTNFNVLFFFFSFLTCTSGNRQGSGITG